jgi:hypothetical protein
VIVFFPIYPRPISAFSRKKENVFIYIQRRSSFKKSFASFCPVLVGWHGRKAEEEKRGENSSGLWFATKKKIPHGRKNKGMPKGFFFQKVAISGFKNYACHSHFFARTTLSATA